MVRNAAVAMACLVFFAGNAMADKLYGTIKYKDGSKDKGVSAITTSRNDERGKNDGKGNYTLDFKGKVGKKVTVYVNGKTYVEILVKGDTVLDITIP